MRNAALSRRPTWERASPSCVGLPELLGQIEVLLRIDFRIVSRRVRMGHCHTAFDHVLKQMDQIGFLERWRFAKRFAAVLLAAMMIMLLESCGPVPSKPGNARVFTVREIRFDTPMDARHATV